VPTPDADPIVEALRRMGLAAPGEAVALTPLAGGVSSDIYRAELASGPVCVKRALPKLKVAADWRAPTERNRYEVGWLRFAATVVPDAVPPVLGADDVALAFAMPWLPPERYPVWKSLLRDGVVEPAFAGQVGSALAAIHAASAGRADLAREFATDANFHAIRLEPYLEATGREHPDLAAALAALVARTASTRLALVHGDVSPKNVLAGPRGPVFLDAECAWYGDPAFDLAFCLNHLLLKGVWRPTHRRAYHACFVALRQAYAAGVSWEPASGVLERAAALLPALMLARVDGKSPVEYIRTPANHDAVRQFARERVARPPGDPLGMASDWLAHLDAHPPLAEA
jgi:aminoglycoside phosphotransferase (APT) family kinase protein